MAQGTQFDTFSYVYDGFDQLLNDYVLDSAEKLSTAIAPTAYAMLAIYFVLWGFSMIRNIIEEPVTDGLFRMLKVSLILGFALNSGRYAGDITSFFMQTPEAMAQVVVLDSSTDGASIGSTADALVQRTIDSGTKIWDQAGVMNGNVGHYFVAILVMAFGFVLSAVAFMIFMFAKFGLVFLLALGPIFILMLMFGPTRALFEGWLRQLVTLALTMVFILAAATFIFSMVEAVAERADSLMAADQLLQGLVQLGAATMAGTVLLLNVKGMASAVAGGMSMAMGQALRRVPGAGRAVGLAAQGATAVATGGASVGISAAAATARATGNLLRATNTIRR